MQTRDQRYATTAYGHISAMKEKEKKNYTLYGSLAHKLPMLIHRAGLAQALAFVNTRVEEKISAQFLHDLAQTLGRENGETLLKQVREANLSEYMLLTQQVLAALLWYKRFAQSILDVEADDASQEDLHE